MGTIGTDHILRSAIDLGIDHDWQVEAVNRTGKTGGAVWTFRTLPAFFKRGDVNSDESVNITDCIFTLHFIFLGGAEPGCQKTMDSTDDGLVNITDVIYLLYWIFQGGEDPLPPFASCGPDLAKEKDDLTCRSFPACSQ